MIKQMHAPLFDLKPGQQLVFSENECPDGELTKRLIVSENEITI